MEIKRIPRDAKTCFGKINNKLGELMEEKNISTNKLARYADITYGNLKNYRDGSIQRTDLYILAKICYCLGCNITDILEYTE